MKRLNWMFAFVLVLLLSACGQEEAVETEKTSTKEKEETTEVVREEPLSEQEFVQMFSDPKKFKNARVEYTGRVFTVEKDEEQTYLQVWADPENAEGNHVVVLSDPDAAVEIDDFIKVKGVVVDELETENAFGAELKLPVIAASDYEVVDYMTAMSPTLKEVIVNQEQDQKGFVIKVQKIEFAETETRVYISVQNKSDSKINFWSFNSKLVQNETQFEIQDNWEAEYPQVSDEILPGVTSEGIITFQAVDFESGGDVQLYLNGVFDDYTIEIDDFRFDIKL